MYLIFSVFVSSLYQRLCVFLYGRNVSTQQINIVSIDQELHTYQLTVHVIIRVHFREVFLENMKACLYLLATFPASSGWRRNTVHFVACV